LKGYLDRNNLTTNATMTALKRHSDGVTRRGESDEFVLLSSIRGEEAKQNIYEIWYTQDSISPVFHNDRPVRGSNTAALLP
jgi:hypothetical protein